MRIIGLIGCGVVGGVLRSYLRKLDSDGMELRQWDPAKGLTDDLSPCDAVFISVPADTLPEGQQDLGPVRESLYLLRKALPASRIQIPVFIRTTVLPGTCNNLSKDYGLNVYAMPEFLTERTAADDFQTQPLIVGGRDIMPYTTMTLLRDLFPNKKQNLVRNTEAEMIKYAHNCFAAVKVNYFNMISELCEQFEIDYSTVRTNTITVSGYFSPNHTLVPGPDGKRGFGGKCLPKDLKAFVHFLEAFKALSSCHFSSLQECMDENRSRRQS